MAAYERSSNTLMLIPGEEESIIQNTQPPMEEVQASLNQPTMPNLNANINSKHGTKSEIAWKELYPSMRSLAQHFVYSFNISCWYGQEQDIVEDVVQESARRILEHSYRAERREVEPIISLEHVIWTVVRNCCIDFRRRDRRLLRIPTGENSIDAYPLVDDLKDLAEEATENLYLEEIFSLLAYEIAKFPEKQRRALLIDLANRMTFEGQQTPLQKAFLAVGIRLQKYRQPLPENSVERSRHASLLSAAYKRVAHIHSVQELISSGSMSMEDVSKLVLIEKKNDNIL
jgi:DNA-directed RNA polymerase specialized sigma24 family protein